MRWVATQFPDAPLRRIFTLGSPQRGTRMAYFGLGPNARQMQPDSPTLAALGETVPVALTAFYSDLDQLVHPAESARFGDDQRFVAETGHFAILYSPEVAESLIRTLAEERQSTG